MSRKKNINECPACQKIPCQCAGGGAADENANDENSNTMKASDGYNGGFIQNVDVYSGLDDVLDNRPAWCTLFAVSANILERSHSESLQQEDSINTSPSMGMSISGTDE